MILILDLGNSNAKATLMDGNDVVDSKKERVAPYNMLSTAFKLFEEFGHRCNQFMCMSMSDSVVWEDKKGNYKWMPALMDIGWQEGLTPYTISGHPRTEALKGSANQMLWLQKEVGLEKIKRIVPVSTFIASKIAGVNWKTWDTTHASNSGFYDYRNGNWAEEATPFIEAGVIGKDIMPCSRWIWVGMPWVMLGGHDSTFINATDTPYSTKPYVSCGTWLTVSVQRSTRTHGLDVEDSGRTRFITTPNGAVVEQLCFQSHDKSKDINTIKRFFEERLPENAQHAPIQVFGTWGSEIASALYKDFDIELVSDTTIEDESLPRKAAEFIRAHTKADQNHGCFAA